MRNYFRAWLLAVTAIVSTPVILAQTAPRGKVPKTRAVTAAPDFSGVWFVREYSRTILPKEDPPFQPGVEALFKARDLANMQSDPDVGPDPTQRCIPPGIPRTMLQPFPWEIVQTADRVIMIFEYQSLVRQIFMAVSYTHLTLPTKRIV